MVFRLPRSGGLPQDLPLVTKLDLALCQFSQKRAAATLADQFVDIGNHVDGEDNVCSTIHSLGHTPSVTYRTTHNREQFLPETGKLNKTLPTRVS